MLPTPPSVKQDLPHDLGSLVEVQKGNGSGIYVMTSDTQKKFALKMVGNHLTDRKKELENEFQILQSLNHQHIVRTFGSLKKDFAYRDIRYSCMVLEYARRGSMLELFNFFKAPSTGVARSIFKDLAFGLQYLHSQGVAHLDLKLDNVLVFQLFDVKIADFGLSENSKISALTKYVGTPYYMPPEIIQLKKDFDASKPLVPYAGNKADVFSLGVMLTIMVLGFPIFKNAHSSDETYKKIIEGDWEEIWESTKVRARLDTLELETGSMVEEFISLIQGMLNPNPTERFNISQVLEHPWFLGTLNSPREFYENKIASMKSQRAVL